LADEASTLCASCGQTLQGKYCSRCGERALVRDEYSLRRFLVDATRDISNGDAKLYRTLWLLVRRPGQLTTEFLRGSRVNYLRPVQLFLLANLVYFVIQPRTGFAGFNTHLTLQMDDQFYSEALHIRQQVEQRIAQRNITFSDYNTAFNTRSSLYARSLTVLMVPLLGLALALVFAGKRKPLAAHLVFATHFMAWQLLVVFSAFLFVLSMMAPYVGWLFDWASRAGMPGIPFVRFALFEMGSLLVILPYLFWAVRRVYAVGRVFGGVATFLLAALLLVVIVTYRFLLFWLTFATV
jgi:uncharacterized protein DUF3667